MTVVRLTEVLVMQAENAYDILHADAQPNARPHRREEDMQGLREVSAKCNIQAHALTLLAITGVIIYWRGVWTLWCAAAW